MTIIDTSTRLLEIAAMTEGTSAGSAHIVDQMWFSRYPRPERCICDQGVEFKGEFAEPLESYGVARINTTTKTPQANGVIERTHRTINGKLRTEIIENAGDWENCLSAVMFALSAAPHDDGIVQAAFGRDLLFDCRIEVDWEEQQKRKQT